jgi:hypothetical protein
MNESANTHGVGELHALQRDVPPPRDLWPGIEAAIRADGATRAAPPAAARWRPPRWAFGLVAGVALLANGIWIGRVILPPAQSTTMATTTVAPAVLPVASFTPGPAYDAARAAELAQLPARLAALPEPTREQVRRSLDTLQRSITEISAALGQEPANALLQSLLIDTYQEEMRVLTTLNAAGAAGEEI